MKKIVITSNKFIPSKGVHGPVLTPYMESGKEICKMLARGIVVEEVLENGEHRKLDVNSALEESNKPLKKEEVKPVVPTVNVENKKDTVQMFTSNNNSSRKDKKKNKNKKREELGFDVDTFESK